MTGGLIFKTELFKFFKDKYYLIFAGVLGVLNTLAVILSINLMNFSDLAAGFIILFAMFSFIVSLIFLFIFPFHMVSEDYKNNVIALMMASGVNRTKLFFAKFGAVLLAYIMILLVLFLLPLIIIMIKFVSSGGMDMLTYIFNDIGYAFSQHGSYMWGLIFVGFFSALASMVMIFSASILMKGSGLAFLVYFGFAFASNIIRQMIVLPLFVNGTLGGTIIAQIIVDILIIVGFGALGLITMKRQNL